MMSPADTIGTPRNDRISGWADGPPAAEPRVLGDVGRAVGRRVDQHGVEQAVGAGQRAELRDQLVAHPHGDEPGELVALGLGDADGGVAGADEVAGAGGQLVQHAVERRPERDGPHGGRQRGQHPAATAGSARRTVLQPVAVASAACRLGHRADEPTAAGYPHVGRRRQPGGMRRRSLGAGASRPAPMCRADAVALAGASSTRSGQYGGGYTRRSSPTGSA